jgi:hypothetical protein
MFSPSEGRPDIQSSRDHDAVVVHLSIGHRKLRDVDYYRDDEIVKRVLGLKRLPDMSTLSRSLRCTDELSVEKVQVE